MEGDSRLFYTITGSIVTYNNMGKIEQAIASVLQQTKDIPFHLFVVDNNSTDGTPEWIEENYPQVEVIRMKENVGFGSGHNQVLPKLSSKYHVLINPDIILHDHAITQMCDYMDEHDDITLLSPKVLFPDGREQVLGKRHPWVPYLFASRIRGKAGRWLLNRYAMKDKDLSKPIEIQNASGCFLVVRTDAFCEVHGFDENYFLYFEDCDLTRKLSYLGKIIYYPQATVYHIWTRGSKNSNALLKVHIKSMFYYYYKWYLKRIIKRSGLLV